MNCSECHKPLDIEGTVVIQMYPFVYKHKECGGVNPVMRREIEEISWKRNKEALDRMTRERKGEEEGYWPTKGAV